ncbi:MAG: CinA family protein [Bifidobacteriaceae bacterium]|nr:CinA family protein [Bifidobacteriaceae bacterium]
MQNSNQQITVQLHAQCDEVAQKILQICVDNNLKIAAAESLTSGLLADSFVRIAGASQVFLGSAVTYDIRAKHSILHVSQILLDENGAVHPEVAQQMAEHTAQLYNQTEYDNRIIGLATTGVAGPGADGDKPAGLVYVAVSLPACIQKSSIVKKLQLQGDREQIRMQTVYELLQILYVALS